MKKGKSPEVVCHSALYTCISVSCKLQFANNNVHQVTIRCYWEDPTVHAVMHLNVTQINSLCANDVSRNLLSARATVAGNPC